MTTNSGKQSNSYPDRMRRVVQLAMEEILGHAGVQDVLNRAGLPAHSNHHPPYNQDHEFPFMDISHMLAGLESVYGLRAGRGLALCIGRACFKYGFREFGSELGMTDLAFRLLPLQTKLITGSEAFAALFNTSNDQQIRLERDEKYIFWHIEPCPLCRERQADGPCCHLAVGLLQEALFWVSGGKYFEIEETKCIACGDEACKIRVDRTPMGG